MAHQITIALAVSKEAAALGLGQFLGARQKWVGDTLFIVIGGATIVAILTYRCTGRHRIALLPIHTAMILMDVPWSSLRDRAESQQGIAHKANDGHEQLRLVDSP